MPTGDTLMSVRWTKRPQNICRSCRYTWYPRGKNVSAQCPRCGSQEVETQFEAFIRAIAYLFEALIRAIAYLFEALFSLLASAVLGAYRAVQAIAQTEFAKRCVFVLLLPFRWLYSVKDDLFPDEDYRLNALSLMTKRRPFCFSGSHRP